ncbi:hypothetical protein SteCoe_26515 [Stentor coeruleus]|uniref:Myb-like DNA-binding domain containing protein n=1 Tax=Stentor coeruleus TaxID=5963 RepID=A0A1R2BCQ3_9CILI|nr:hypothetical protein SteCoe_26515 [Stentor coeruleus]
MNFNLMYAYMLRCSQYADHFCSANWPVTETQINPQPVTSIDDQNKKYKRTWKKNQVEEIFSRATKHCIETGRNIEDLTIKDFEVLARDCDQTPEQVMNKVNEIHQSGTLRPGIWSQSEDDLLKDLLRKGIEKWGQIASLLNKEIHKGLRIRTGKQCKERWNNYLNPDVNRGAWTDKEDLKILESYKQNGNKWSIIAKSIKNRTESSVKNRIKSLLNKIKQDLTAIDDISSGIDKLINKKRQNMIVISENSSASPKSGYGVTKKSFSELSKVISQSCAKESFDS